MTQTEFVNLFGAVASTMVELPEFKALLETAREENPYLNNATIGADPTSVVRNSGRADGWAACVQFLKSAHRPKPGPDPKQLEMRYQDPPHHFPSLGEPFSQSSLIGGTIYSRRKWSSG